MTEDPLELLSDNVKDSEAGTKSPSSSPVKIFAAVLFATIMMGCYDGGGYDGGG
jgi:hypothetical protein